MLPTQGGHHRLLSQKPGRCYSSRCWNQPGVRTKSAGVSPALREPRGLGDPPAAAPGIRRPEVCYQPRMCHLLPIWLVLLCCLLPQGSEVRVHQPPELRASPGGSVLLNCTFSAPPTASKLAVTWVRRAPGGRGEVQIYPPSSQGTKLRSRLALDSGRFRHQRDASLRLANLTWHDAGLYRCFIWTSATSSHAGNGTELSVREEGPGSGVWHWAACGPLGVLAAVLLVLHTLVCRECQGLRRRRRELRSGAQGQDVAGDRRSRRTLGLAGKDGAPRPL